MPKKYEEYHMRTGIGFNFISLGRDCEWLEYDNSQLLNDEGEPIEA